MNTAATSLPVTAVPSPPPPTQIPVQIVGYSEDGTQALFSDAFGTVAPLLVTQAPSAKRRMSTLEILLIAVAVAVGVVTLCLLISVSKK